MDSLTPISHYPQEIKDLAYEVYAVRAKRDMRKTLELLDAMPIPKIPESTVYWWRSHYGWDRKLELESADKQRELINLHVSELRVAAPEAVKYLRDVIHDKADPHPQKVAAARTLVSENRALIVAAVNAGLLTPESTEDEKFRAKLEGLTMEELMALETPWIPEP
jgi:hypothetical protein